MRFAEIWLAAASLASVVAGVTQAAPTPPLFGDDAWLVESGGAGTVTSVASGMDCVVRGVKPPCRLHPIAWAVAPDAMVGFADIFKTGKRAGIDFLVCAVSPGGTLTGCEATTPEAQAIAIDLLHSFKAPPKTIDNKPLENGPIAIQINWNALYPAAQAAQPEPTQAASADAKVYCSKSPRYYPIKAQRTNTSGTAHINCLVDQAGKLGDCHVIDESPPGYDFGSAAICMAPLFKMRAGSTPGGRMTVPLKFVLPNR